MRFPKRLLVITAMLLSLAACNAEPSSVVSNRETLKVQTYTTPLPDSINLHWIETDKGIIVIDAQRRLSEAKKVVAKIKQTGKPIIGIFITHPHSDHYGGLSVLAEAAGKSTPIYAAAKTIESMRDDTRKYNAQRREKFGEDFPTQKVISSFLPNRIVRDGETVELGGLTFKVIEKAMNESETATLFYLPEHEVLFSGDLINNKATPFPAESVENWINQLREVSEQLPNVRQVYIGHGTSGDPKPLIKEQLEYLVTMRDSIKRELDRSDGQLSSAGRDKVIAELEAKYPDYVGAIGQSRREVLTQIVPQVAKQLQKAKR